MKNLLLNTFLVFISVFSLNAQSGLIRGVIIDNEFQDPVPFTNIIVKEVGTGTTSDFDGNYGDEEFKRDYQYDLWDMKLLKSAM